MTVLPRVLTRLCRHWKLRYLALVVFPVLSRTIPEPPKEWRRWMANHPPKLKADAKRWYLVCGGRAKNARALVGALWGKGLVCQKSCAQFRGTEWKRVQLSVQLSLRLFEKKGFYQSKSKWKLKVEIGRHFVLIIAGKSQRSESRFN